LVIVESRKQSPEEEAMFCVRSSVAAYFAGCLLALVTYPSPASAAEDKPKPQVLFTKVNIFDGKNDTLAEGMSVLVEGNLIKKIAKGNIDDQGQGRVLHRSSPQIREVEPWRH